MIEIEAKLSLTDPARLEDLLLLEAVGSLRVAARREVRQSDFYHDTPTHEVAASGASVRERRIEGERLYTLKLGAVGEDGISRRLEIEEPAGDRDLVGWLVWQIDRGRVDLDFPPEMLAPVLEIHTHRSVLELEGDGAEVEMAVDRARFVGPGGEVADLEIELELKSGPDSVLPVACGWLRAQFPLVPSRGSKYSRALGVVGSKF